MKVLQIFNQYRSHFNGEAMVVQQTTELIQRYGGEVFDWQRSSQRMKRGLLGKVSAAVGGVYSRSAYRDAEEMLEFHQPDIVHVHNVYPFFSPSVLAAARAHGFPVVMSVHNQNLTCPKADHLRNGQLCDRCYGGGEFNCVLHNCRNNVWESIAYAIRSNVARRWGLFRDNVTRFIALTNYSRERLIGAGYPEAKIDVLSNMVTGQGDPVPRPEHGQYVAFAGRMSEEKGVDLLLEAAQGLSRIPFKLAGDGPALAGWKSAAPTNVEFLGALSGAAMPDFYRQARVLVLPSRVNEMCPLVVSEAMNVGIPVITSAMGGQAELVDDQVTGRHFEPENSAHLKSQIELVWDRSDLVREYGRSGFEKARREYRQDVYFQKLMAIYRHAMEDMDRDAQCIDEMVANAKKFSAGTPPLKMDCQTGTTLVVGHST